MPQRQEHRAQQDNARTHPPKQRPKLELLKSDCAVLVGCSDWLWRSWNAGTAAAAPANALREGQNVSSAEAQNLQKSRSAARCETQNAAPEMDSNADRSADARTCIQRDRVAATKVL